MSEERGISKKIYIEEFHRSQELQKSDTESDHESNNNNLIDLTSLKEKLATPNASARSSSKYKTSIVGNFKAEETESWDKLPPRSPTLVKRTACMTVEDSLSHHTSITLTNKQGQTAKFEFQGSLLNQFKTSSDSSSDSQSADPSEVTVQCSNQKLTRKIIHRNYLEAIGSKKRKAVSKTHSQAVTKTVINVPPAQAVRKQLRRSPRISSSSVPTASQVFTSHSDSDTETTDSD